MRLKVELFFYSVACVVFPPGTTVSKLLTSKSLWPTKLCLNTCSIAFVKITNEWCIYIALLLCIAIHPQRFTIMWGGLPSTTTSGSNPEGSFTACLLKKISFPHNYCTQKWTVISYVVNWWLIMNVFCHVSASVRSGLLFLSVSSTHAGLCCYWSPQHHGGRSR